MDPAPLVSVVVCTRNRAAVLRRTLPALAAALRAAPAGALEAVIVDNDSTDDTARVVSEAGAGLMRHVVEREPGLNPARNAGIREARGGVVWFLDDDAVVHPEWAGAILQGVEQRAYGLFAGRVLLSWPAREPAWLSPGMRGWYSGLDLGLEDFEIERPRCPYGVNMGIRREVLQALGGFQPGLDRVGTNLLSNGDREFAYRAYDHGFRARYLASAAVDHLIPEDRARIRWLLRRAYWGGISDAIAARLRESRGGGSSGRAARGWIGRNAGRTAAAALQGRRGLVIVAVRACYAAGALRGLVARRLQPITAAPQSP